MAQPVIFAQQLANVVRQLVALGVSADDPQLYVKFKSVFATVVGGSVAPRPAQVDLDNLPDLDDNVVADIVPPNLMALRTLYYCAQLEDLKLFAVADKVAEQFRSQSIPVSRSAGSEAIYLYYKDAINRLTEYDRRGIYARCFGFAQGAVDEPTPNREFSDLWIRFLSSVSILTREEAATIRKALTGQQVFKNARDLAVNLSLHGYGISHFAAVELRDHIDRIIKMLRYPDVLQAYGVNDVWQLVERVSDLYLGGAVNSVRQRTLAKSGAAIIEYLAGNYTALINPTGSLDISSDDEIVKHVERWLAVTGTDDNAIDKYSASVAVSQQPTIPNMSLQSVQDALAALQPNGVGAAMQQLSSLTPIGKA